MGTPRCRGRFRDGTVSTVASRSASAPTAFTAPYGRSTAPAPGHPCVFDEAVLPEMLAHWMVSVITDALRERALCHVALSGGATAQRAYARLAESIPARAIAWSRVHVWVTDECTGVAPSERTIAVVQDTLLRWTDIPTAHVHPLPIDAPDLARAASECAQRLPTAFDLLLLGVGEDGHTAGLYTEEFDPTGDPARVIVTHGPRPGRPRLTISPAVIHEARAVGVVATGARKAGVVARSLESSVPAPPLLALLANRGIWFLDHAAASRIKSRWCGSRLATVADLRGPTAELAITELVASPPAVIAYRSYALPEAPGTARRDPTVRGVPDAGELLVLVGPHRHDLFTQGSEHTARSAPISLRIHEWMETGCTLHQVPRSTARALGAVLLEHARGVPLLPKPDEDPVATLVVDVDPGGRVCRVTSDWRVDEVGAEAVLVLLRSPEQLVFVRARRAPLSCADCLSLDGLASARQFVDTTERIVFSGVRTRRPARALTYTDPAAIARFTLGRRDPASVRTLGLYLSLFASALETLLASIEPVQQVLIAGSWATRATERLGTPRLAELLLASAAGQRLVGVVGVSVVPDERLAILGAARAAAVACPA